jgi:hypothetical protein
MHLLKVNAKSVFCEPTGLIQTSAWGTAPGAWIRNLQALKARFSRGWSVTPLNRAYSADSIACVVPGALPQAGIDRAPLARLDGMRQVWKIRRWSRVRSATRSC